MVDIRRSTMSSEKEVNGVWVDLDGRSKIKLARFNNPRFRKELERLNKPYRRREARGKRVPEKVKLDLLRRAAARTIVLDWEGFKEDGEDFPYSEENAFRLMAECPELADDIIEMSRDESIFFEDEDEDESEDDDGEGVPGNLSDSSGSS